MPKISFTKKVLSSLRAPKGQRVYYHDTRTPGLALCVTPNGTKTFYLYRRVAGRPERIRIGRHPEVTVYLARREASKLCGLIAQGKNPQQTRRQARAELTLGALFEDYLEKHAKPFKRSWPEDQRQFNSYLKIWRNRKLSEISKADVRSLHTRMGDKNGPYMANRVLALLSKLFNHASEIGFEGPNPARGMRRFKEQSRDRFLGKDELVRFFKALAEESDELWRDFFVVLLLTGARRSNVQAMKWDDIDLSRGLWRIPASASKSAEPLVCVLVEPVIAILDRRARESVGGDYVFSSKGQTGHLVEPKKAWRRVLDVAGIEDLRIHDLRRTLGSWQAATGASLPVIARSLGHKDLATTQVYARLDMAPVRASVEAATGEILKAGKARPTKVSRRKRPRAPKAER